MIDFVLNYNGRITFVAGFVRGSFSILVSYRNTAMPDDKAWYFTVH